MDAALLPLIRRQRGSAPASRRWRRPSAQFPAHVGDDRADSGLVADEPEGEAHQYWREGRQQHAAMPPSRWRKKPFLNNFLPAFCKLIAELGDRLRLCQLPVACSGVMCLSKP